MRVMILLGSEFYIVVLVSVYADPTDSKRTRRNDTRTMKQTLPLLPMVGVTVFC